MNNWRNLSFAACATAIYMWLASLWVPIVFKSYTNYRDASLFDELKPRALLGTLAELLGLDLVGFNLLLLGTQFLQLLIILLILRQAVLRRPINYVEDPVVFFGIGFIFTFSTATFLTFGPASFIDAAAYAFIALAAVLIHNNDRLPNWTAVAVNLLLVAAVMTHEKSIFDISILAAWLFWKSGLRRTLAYLAPATLISLLFIAAVSSKKTSGLSPAEYADILGNGLTFLLQRSLNIWGVILGGGSMWFLYSAFAWQFVSVGTTDADKRRRLFLAILMILICMSGLLVASDTNRIVGLIWLPTFLLMQEIDLRKLFHPVIARIGLLGLCVFQLTLPPVLMFSNGIAPLNCYSVTLIMKLNLPGRMDVEPEKMGPFGIYIVSHPEINRPIIERCFPAGQAAD